MKLLFCLLTGIRFLVLGDVHLDKFEFHDMDYVYTRPSDWKQITEEYPYFTAAYYPKLFATVNAQTENGCRAVVQLGDLMEGVSGNYDLACEMAEWSVEQIDKAAGKAKVLLVKGNHDVSNSPGQPQAWKDIVLPYVEEEIGQDLDNAMYSYRLSPDVEIFCAEQFFSNDDMLPEAALLEFLKRELPKSKAKYKFLATHQPVIPVTDRCWHLFSGIRRKVEDPSLREEFLELLAEHKVTVLCAHLHQYSTIVRETDKGNVVQIMMCSTVHSFNTKAPQSEPEEYLTPEAMDPKWQSGTLEVRKGLIDAENPFIKHYTRSTTPGYAVIEAGKDLTFHFYNGYSTEPAESFSITDLYQL